MKVLPRIVLLAFAFASCLANAQFNLAGPAAKMTVLMNPDVQKELKLSGDQKKQLQKILKDATSNPTAAMSGTMMPGDFMSAMDAKFLAVLDEPQTTRLTELWVQYEGPCVLKDKVVAEKVGLKDDQPSKIAEIWGAYEQEFMEGMRSPSGSKGLKKKRKAANEATLAILTAEQAATYEAMKGKEFKFKTKKEI
ncbi:MAG: hypothetical protein QOJ65_1053 [Fimbriimonadaceae bacterium]|jgi:hypothetical protein|nr:hypothetical protein [Fimbriimonadaceae bacterium]